MRRLGSLIIVLAVIFIGFLIWWNNGLKPVNSADTSSKIFLVAPGTNVREIGNSLKEEGLIRDPVVFFLYVKKERLDTKLQAGDFRLSANMSIPTIIEQLQTGSLDIWVTIPEGLRAEEVAEILSEKMPMYDETWVSALVEHEGYLFPDTYLIPRDATAETVINVMRKTFFAKVADLGLTESSPNLQRVVTMASLIERESRIDEEKPLIASVIQNRINDGMPLDIDATLQYIVGEKDGKWWSVPTGEEKTINSLYNTYRNVGLPPGPICNPGIGAIQAAMNPASSDYYFYIHDPSGQVHFARTNSEHNSNVSKYLR
ncbi:MAG TPA: endolytic transglycosylase MltG [Candidatus Levybacteria bacterium]|nr:endolytic transglycosylase MltG [Candidatus Levybacteria bacterium]